MIRAARRRPAFSLIEILLVITIIITLASLLLVAVNKTRVLGDDMECRQEIADLHKAIGKFVNDPRVGSVGFIPSRLAVGASADPASALYISKVFPHLTAAGKLNVPGGTLEGIQVVVFLLNGPAMSTNPGMVDPMVMGWSSSPKDPTVAGGERLTFFEFKVNRLAFPAKGDGAGNYATYNDRWGTPFAYFSSWSPGGGAWGPNSYNAGDTPQFSGAWGIQPFLGPNPPATVPNPDGWQIVSAGRDKKFGPGGTNWGPQNPYSASSAQTKIGIDDLSNFATAPLGARQ